MQRLGTRVMSQIPILNSCDCLDNPDAYLVCNTTSLTILMLVVVTSGGVRLLHGI